MQREKMANNKATKVMNALSDMVREVEVNTVDKFINSMSTRIEVDEEMHMMFQEFKKGLDIDGGMFVVQPKKKRAPSAYNLFISTKIAEFKAAGHKGNLMKMAVDAWKNMRTTTDAFECENQRENEKNA